MRLLLLALVAPLAAGLGITCSCSDPVSCPDGSCATQGVCRASLQRTEGGLGTRRRLQCLHPEHLVPRGRPFECQNSKKLLDRWTQVKVCP
jgi:hypothetical protein